MSCGIYKITNVINKKAYIGQSINIEARWEKHKKAKDTFAIHQAIKKYGIDKFEFEIIELCNESLLNEREIYWINKYNSLVPYGYNMIEGGSNGAGLARGKEVYQFDINGKFIAKYRSAHVANEITGIDYSSICACCRGEKMVAKGYQWRYEDGINSIKKLNDYIHMSTKIVQYSLDGTEIAKYNSLQEAANKTGISKSTICNVCKGRGHTAGGFRWCYEDQPLKIKERKKQSNRKIVRQFDKQNNFIQQFDSLSDAAAITGIHLGNIGQVCNGKRKTAGGYIWKYV